MKRNNLLRLLGLIMASLMAISLLAACTDAENNNNPNETTAALETDTDTADTTSNVDKYGYLLDNIPNDLKFDGKTINILYWEDVEHEEFKSDGETGDPVNDAIYKRNLTVEERLGVTINFIPQAGDSADLNNWVKRVEAELQSGANSFDIMAGYSLSVAATATKGYCFNLLDEDCMYLDLEMPWWPDRLITEATINDKLFFASGDISANALYMMYVCYVNTAIHADMGLENIFDLVDNNQWTYDKFIEMCHNVYFDNNADGIKNSGDRFGYMVSGIHSDPWFYGSGALIAEKDASGMLVASTTFGGERVIKSLEKITNLLYNTTDGLYTASVEHQREFNNGNLLFITDRARVSFKVLLSDSLNYSIVPCPKYDSNQDSFVTVMGNPFTLYAIPIDATSDELPMLSAFIETYASEAYRQVTPAVFEITLKTKYVQEEDSARMYDIIRENLTFDLGRIFSDSLIGQGTFRDAIKNNAASSWASMTKSQLKVLDKRMETVRKLFED